MHWAPVCDWSCLCGEQFHATLWTPCGFIPDHVRMHRTNVRYCCSLLDFWFANIHLSDEGKCLVRVGFQVEREPLAFGDHVRIRSKRLEPKSQRRCRLVFSDGD